jgi:hypothetical protein
VTTPLVARVHQRVTPTGSERKPHSDGERANRRSGRASDRLAAPEHQFEFQCECGENSGCDAVVLMTLDEYERVRSQRDRFAVVPGHENSEIERVVERDDRYVVVDKLDEAERFVE